MFKIFSPLFISICLLANVSLANADDGPVLVVEGTASISKFAKVMLQLALDKSGSTNEITVSEGNQFISVARVLDDMKGGTLDVIWTVTSDAIEDQTIPVRIPLYMGLLGSRVIMVHADNRGMFRDVKTLDQLKQYTMGQGTGWTDTDILRANGFKVIETAKWVNLFHMTDGKRFQGYPRGVQEPWGELEMFKELDLAVDPHILVRYISPFYFFVNPKRPELARKIERGLNIAIADGSFLDAFFSDELVQSVIAKAGLEKRRVFEIDNPLLPDATPTDRPELWFSSINLEEIDMAKYLPVAQGKEAAASE